MKVTTHIAVLFSAVSLAFVAALALALSGQAVWSSQHWFFAAIAAVTALGAAVGSALLVRRISCAVDELRDSVQAIVAKGGDLTRELKIESNDEFGHLAADINTLIRWLRETIASLYRQGGDVAVKVCEMGKQTRASASTAVAQNEAATAVAAAAEEMTSSLCSVADSTRNAAGAAATVDRAANAGMEAVVKACDCMEQIRSSVEETRNTVSRLTDSSAKISEIAGMIREIANQTNLLALNAAIEAARAGEHGRGFAVVADEVKNLSAKTATSTHEISEIIGAIQQESGLALDAIQKEHAKVVSGVETAQAARNELAHILRMADDSKEMIDHIAAATEEQSAVTAEITKKIHCISDMANNVNCQMKETDVKLLHLSEVAETIFSTIGRFSVGTYHDRKRAVAMAFRDQVVKALERSMASGAIAPEQLFSSNYIPIPNTNPQKFTTPFDAFFDRVVAPMQDAELAAHPDITSMLCLDQNGYVPSQISANKARTKLILKDRTTQKHCQNTEPFLLQTFERPSTGEIIVDLSCPIVVQGKRWGFVRCGYKPSEQ